MDLGHCDSLKNHWSLLISEAFFFSGEAITCVSASGGNQTVSNDEAPTSNIWEMAVEMAVRFV